MKYTHIIWDFNGTILDDVRVGIDSVNVLLLRRGLLPIASVEEYRRVFGFPIIKYYERIGFDFQKENYADVAVEWVDEYMSRVPNAKINNGAENCLVKVRDSGRENLLVSATEINMLKKQLGMLGISHLFDGVYGLDNIHAYNKTAVAKLWREKNPDAKALFIGDTDHDLETAEAIGADCILYSGGHQSKQSLATFGCPVVDDLGELDGFIFS